MSKEEKEAVKLVSEQYKKWIDNPEIMIVPEQCKMVTALGIVLNLVEKQNKIPNEDTWFNKYIKKCNEKNALQDKCENVIDELVQALAEERGEEEENIREYFGIE